MTVCIRRPVFLKSAENEKGNGLADVLVFASVIVFLLLPLFSAVMEKHMLDLKLSILRDAIDITNMAVYNSLECRSLSRGDVAADGEEGRSLFENYLSQNLKLDASLRPVAGSVAGGEVVVNSLIVYTGGFPVQCPEGTTLEIPSVHSSITVPIKPMMFRRILLKLTGREYVFLEIHVDTEMPVDR